MKITISLLSVVSAISTANAAISLSGPSVGAGWISLGANFDFLDDQQTGDPASDIVGSAASPGFFTAFDNAGTASLTDGFIGFRVRLDDVGIGGAFTRNLWIGIDADLNGSVDAFIGVATPSQSTLLGIYDSGTDTNISPSTTSIATLTPTYTYTATAANYDYRAVNYLTDGGTLNDLTPTSTGDTDYYVSCIVSFTDVAAFLTAQMPGVFNPTTPFTENTPLRYVLGTSTQSNTLNQDLGGIDNKALTKKDESKTWAELGGFSPTITASGQLVPEVSATLLALVGSVFGFAFNRRR